MKQVLDRFSAATREWFQGTFAAPTEAQVQGWAAIAKAEHTLILAPTGSGKTLAAFLWCLDQLATQPVPMDKKRRCRVLYVSPLKALAHDVERNLKVVDQLKTIADQKKITPSQLALAWVLAQGKDMVPIPGTKRRTYLEENVAATKVQLSKSDLARIEEVAPKGFASGGRYHDMSTVNV